MTVYLDTSDLIKLYVDEADSDSIRGLVDDADLVATSALAYPEARATIARRRRERLMTRAEATRAVAQLDADWTRMAVLGLGPDLAIEAGRLADRLRLRGGDAVHLAAFAELLSHAGEGEVRFSSSDVRLSRAARALSQRRSVFDVGSSPYSVSSS